jgi:hypothetical protein
MADKKISALTAATTPLAGTEVLPIVQSGATVKVAVSDLTTGRAISATQITLTTGNVIVANGQGVDFSATPGTGTSELLADYEEGTWTPSISTSGGPVTSYTSSGTYVKVGKTVTVTFNFTVTNYTGGSGTGIIGNLPFASSASAMSGAYRESATTGAIHTLMYDTTTSVSSFALVAWTTGSVGSASFCYTSS